MTKYNTPGVTPGINQGSKGTTAVTLATLLLIVLTVFVAKMAGAMELDWSGQFRSEVHLIKNYTMDSSASGSTPDSNRQGTGGYYITPGNRTDANIRTLFMRLRPKVIVNDAISIKSEWWLGDPIYGMFGSAAPYPQDQRYFPSTYSRGSAISAQRLWGEFGSDFGTIQIGRAPLQWGLGLVWNSGDGLWDRYQSTGDTIRIVSKFGSFTFIPSFVSYSMGNKVGEDASTVGDYSIALKYDNVDESDIEIGVNFIRRLGGASQQVFVGPSTTSSSPVAMGMNYNTWDIFLRKKLGKLTFTGEVPIVTGNIGGLDYSTIAFAGEVGWKMSDSFELQGRLGHAPGQSNSTGPLLDKYKAFYFHPNYKLGLIMFQYNLAGFSQTSTQNYSTATGTPAASSLVSPFDNPISNANYASLYGAYHTDKWTLSGTLTYAQATETAIAGQYFYNHRERRVYGPAVSSQESGLGFETDLGAAFQWDEYFQFRFDGGIFFPGAFYKFSNYAPVENATSPVLAGVFRVGVNF